MDRTAEFNLAVGEIIISISTGEFHSAALTSEGRLFTWGRNAFGQLGDGTTIDKHVPTDITNKFNLATGETITSFSLGFHHSLALTSAGRIFTWGNNSSGQLGDGTTVDKNVPTDITSQFNLVVGESILSASLGGNLFRPIEIDRTPPGIEISRKITHSVRI